MNPHGQFRIADSNFSAGASNFVRIRCKDQPYSAYSAPIAVVVDPSVTSSSPSTINHLSLSRCQWTPTLARLVDIYFYDPSREKWLLSPCFRLGFWPFLSEVHRFSYGFDPFGNLISRATLEGTSPLLTDFTHRMTNAGALPETTRNQILGRTIPGSAVEIPYNFDPSGNLLRFSGIADNPTGAHWDAVNRMRWFVAGDPWLSGTAPTEYYRYDFGNFRWLRRGWNGIPELTLRDAAGQPTADYTIDPQTDQAVWKKEYISGFGQVLAERSIASNTMILMSGIRATGATVVPFSVGTGLPLGTTLAVDIRTDAGPWAHLTGVTVNAQGQFSIADSNFAAGESSFVRVKREDQPDAAYSAPIAVVVDPSVTASSSSTINQISLSRVGTDLKLRWSLAATNNKPFKILFRRADNNTELDLTPMGLPANSRELSLGSQSQNLPAGNFLAHQVLGTIDQGGLGGHFEDGTIPPPTATGPVYIVQYHHRDHLGTLRLITDEMGGLIEAHDYEPFGVELNPPFGAASRKKYTGHERDESTGLDYMLARYYPSTIGRFLSVDPGWDVELGDPMSWHLYGYVRNNPSIGVDPDGRNLWTSLIKVGRYVGKSGVETVAKILGHGRTETMERVSEALMKLPKGSGRIVQTAGDEKNAIEIAKALSSNKMARGKEASRGGQFAEHFHPEKGSFEDVHVQTEAAAKGTKTELLGLFAPFSAGIMTNSDANANEVASAALWDVAKVIDPIFLTDAIEMVFGVDSADLEQQAASQPGDMENKKEK